MADDGEASFKVPDCFLPTAMVPGDIILRTTGADAHVVEFFCHGVILFYNSDYFKTLLCGEWKENQVKLLFCDAGREGNKGGVGPAASSTATANANKNANANANASAPAHGRPAISAAVPPPPYLFDATRSPLLVIRATIEFLDERPETLVQLLNHLYPHLSLQLSPANWQPLWRLADKLGLTALSALCEEYMRDNVLHIDPLTVLTWAKRTSQREWYRKSSEIILDRMASGEIARLETLSLSLQVDHLYAFADQGTRITGEVEAIFQLRRDWDQAAQKAAAKPSRASATALLDVTAGPSAIALPRIRKSLHELAKKYRPLIGQWCLNLPVGDQNNDDDGDNSDGASLTNLFANE